VKAKLWGRYSTLREGGSQSGVVPYWRGDSMLKYKVTILGCEPCPSQAPNLWCSTQNHQIENHSESCRCDRANAGQNDPRVKFLARGADTTSSYRHRSHHRTSTHLLQNELAGANASAETTGPHPLEGAELHAAMIRANGTPTSKTIEA